MKNGLTDLNNLLFAQLERLSDEDISIDELKKEEVRTKMINDTSNNIIRNAELCYKVIQYQHTCEYNGERVPKMLNVAKDNMEAVEKVQ